MIAGMYKLKGSALENLPEVAIEQIVKYISLDLEMILIHADSEQPLILPLGVGVDFKKYEKELLENEALLVKAFSGNYFKIVSRRVSNEWLVKHAFKNPTDTNVNVVNGLIRFHTGRSANLYTWSNFVDHFSKIKNKVMAAYVQRAIIDNQDLISKEHRA